MPIRDACFDLETSSLNADFGVILCGVVKPGGKKPIVFRADDLNPDWETRRSDDSAVLKAIVDELLKYDVLCAHNGVAFDLKFIRARLAFHHLPPLPKLKIIDPVLIARNHFKLATNKLENVIEFLGLENRKTRVDGRVWIQASHDGDRKAMDAIVDHCVRDVVMLEEVVDRVKGYSTAFNDRGSGW